MKYWIVYRDYDYYHCGGYVVGPVALEVDKFGTPYFITDDGDVYYEILKRFDTEFEAQLWNRSPWWKRLWWSKFRRSPAPDVVVWGLPEYCTDYAYFNPVDGLHYGPHELNGSSYSCDQWGCTLVEIHPAGARARLAALAGQAKKGEG